MKNLSQGLGWICIINESARTSCLNTHTQPSMCDRLEPQCIILQIIYLSTVSKIKEAEKDKKRQKGRIA